MRAALLALLFALTGAAPAHATLFEIAGHADGAVLLSHEIAREIEQELEYPGQIKVTVIRESRATDYAR